MQEELKEYEAKKQQLKGAIQANNYKLDESYVRQVAQSGQDMVESVRQGAAVASGQQKDSANSMGCAAKRDAKTDKKKKKPAFSLQ